MCLGSTTHLKPKRSVQVMDPSPSFPFLRCLTMCGAYWSGRCFVLVLAWLSCTLCRIIGFQPATYGKWVGLTPYHPGPAAISWRCNLGFVPLRSCMLLFQGYYPSNSRLDGIHHWGTGRWVKVFQGMRGSTWIYMVKYNQVWINAKTLVMRVAGTLGAAASAFSPGADDSMDFCMIFGHLLPQVCGDAVAVR